MRLIAAILLLVVSANAYEPYLQNRRAAFRQTTAAAAATVIEFDGTDDLISYSGINTADTTYSVTMWVRPAAFTDSWQSLLTVGGGNGMYIRASQLAGFVTSGGGFFTTSTLNAATWYHLAFVNNSGAWVWYINGVSDNSGSGAGSCGSLTRSGDNAGSDTFSGRIGQAAVFNRALTGTEVANLAAKTTTPGTIGDLIAWLKLDDVANGSPGNGVSFVDSSGNGNTGTGDDGANNTGLTGVTADF